MHKIYQKHCKSIIYALLLYLPTALLLLCIRQLSRLTGIAVMDFMRDPISVMDAHPLVGIVSNLGAMIWCTGAAICIFSGAILFSAKRNKNIAAFLLLSGLITAMLLLDDLFLIHEVFLPYLFHIDEKITFSVYILIIAVSFYVFKDLILKTDFIFLLLACCCFGLSITLDASSNIIPIHLSIPEDVTKFWGIVSWCGYFVRLCFQQIKGELCLNKQ